VTSNDNSYHLLTSSMIIGTVKGHGKIYQSTFLAVSFQLI